MPLEGIHPPRIAHQGDEPVMPAAQVHRRGRQVHAYTRRQRQHRARSSATSAATYATSVPGTMRTSTPATATTISAPGSVTSRVDELVAPVTATGTSATSDSGSTLFCSLYSQPRKLPSFSPRSLQNSSCEPPDFLNALMIDDHSLRLFRARMGAILPGRRHAGITRRARHVERIRRCDRPGTVVRRVID